MRDETVRLALPAAGEATERPISIAIVAMGGQGGGVLTDWIVQLAENHGWVAQSTSVPGVAQRTGATIYYIEAMPPLDGRKPILSLMPTPGDVDVVMAAEFMEAGRSILRGLVTPDRTTLIASNHRSFAIGEKIAPGNGIADGAAVTGAIGVAAKTEIIFDLNALAIAHGSVISAAMFGALAAAAVLPCSAATAISTSSVPAAEVRRPASRRLRPPLTGSRPAHPRSRHQRHQSRPITSPLPQRPIQILPG
ncbi:Pyruvate/2-oxoacid:ferredoxin oxidoreductase gamma subunit [Bradyrhizobium sp. i1.7.7]